MNQQNAEDNLENNAMSNDPENMMDLRDAISNEEENMMAQMANDMMPPVASNQNDMSTQNNTEKPEDKPYKVEYVRPVSNEEFQEIFKNFYRTASKLAMSAKKMKELMSQYQDVYEENSVLQQDFNRLKEELQNGIKALG